MERQSLSAASVRSLFFILPTNWHWTYMHEVSRKCFVACRDIHISVLRTLVCLFDSYFLKLGVVLIGPVPAIGICLGRPTFAAGCAFRMRQGAEE